ncbi:MAG: ABC transporter ATP-binding protein [Clostridia bacterium]|nr:ABC transporter ATP-binding protein [Clostridia bacterium]MBQ9847319.1 ABC transporter ATP-binding protein [Clostridia bacterium]MBQ9958702.1 ABC transporter ATP-binding protein [Clostridia bacterium]
MIGANNVTKKFDDFTALDGISCKIESGCIYGLVGSNGAGKSTFLRVLSGVYRADQGDVTIDGEPIYENPSVKKKIMLVPDDLYFLPGASMLRMKKLYKSVYPDFDDKRFSELAECFGLDVKKNLGTFSKGMRRQAATVLALSARPEYIFFDETFDGLDPIMRNVVKRLICEDILDRKATAIITSHSLRELEDTCDQLSLLHKGGLVFESDIQNLKTSLFKVQIAFDQEYDKSKFTGMDILKFTKRGSVSNIIVRGDRDLTVAALSSMKPTLLDVLPLSLEEVFTYEMEALGYKFSDILEG